MPIEQLKQKIANDGLDPSIIEQDEPNWDDDSSSASASAPSAPVKKCSIDPAYKKYFKLKRMHMPIEHLKQKNANDGLDPSVIDQDEPNWDDDASSASASAPSTPAPSAPVKKCSIDPAYKKYFKLKRMHMPIEQLKQKIANDGLDPSIIEQDEPNWDDDSSSQPAPQPSPTSDSTSAPKQPEPQPQPEPEPEPDPYTPPVRAKSTPSVPLRQVYWQTVGGRSLKDTVWEAMTGQRQPLDTKEIEELFEMKRSQPTTTQVAAPQPVEEEKVTFVDAKRETNIGIGLRKLRYTGEEVIRFLTRIDSFSLSLEALTVMAAILPKEEECGAILAYPGDPNNLNSVNAFLFSVAHIPNCLDRVNCLLVRCTFTEERDRVVGSLRDFMADCRLVEENPHFLFLLDYVLEIGNYLNGTSSRGGAVGFHLDILPQLERTKSNDGSVTLVE